MLELLKSQRFQKEYEMYQTNIKKITDDSVRNQAELLLKMLITEIKKLDNHHHDMFTGGQIPTGLSDLRNNVISIRKKLDKIYKDF
jgi:hypothetical protein